MEEILEDIFQVLKSKFGFKSFRPGQLEAILALMQKGKLLCIQPTGHGKSLLYQLPTALLTGITLVISPLLALMRDQISHLNNRFNISAASLNSDQTEEENNEAMQNIIKGNVRVVFIAPEQLDHIDKSAFFLTLPISLLVVDEAHCISTWGHDFRPSYRHIVHFIKALEIKKPDAKILGLTATANHIVQKDITQQLFSAPDAIVLRESMNRPNISLAVIPLQGLSHKLVTCVNLLTDIQGSGLIYCATRENTELVAEYLKEKGVSCIAYHAGFSPQEKREIQEGFTKDHYKVVVATTALGMGIDKANLRFIIHFDIPGSITAYYQEVGRCGRDGLPAQGILLFDPSDAKIQEYFIDSALPSLKDFEKVLAVVKSAEAAPNLTMIKRLTGLHPTRVTIILAELIEQHFLKKESLKGVQVYLSLPRPSDLNLDRYTQQFETKTFELQNILRYAEQKSACRMAILRETLGDTSPLPCSHCDICLKKTQTPTSFSQTEIASDWLNNRPHPISSSKIPLISAGLSLLDGKLRPPLFIHFMKERTNSSFAFSEMYEKLILLLKKQAEVLAKEERFGALVPIPSRTWKTQEAIANALAEHLNIPILPLLSWEKTPLNRQGELLNNDQRHHNVQKCMQADPLCPVPKGALLILDDYIGSGATLKEAGRALRKRKDIISPLIPLTIAAVKWRLGKEGFI